MVNRLRLATDERRSRLLLLGRRIFNERAYDDVSVDDIASAAGISKGLLYHYFPSKRVFYVETVRAAADELIARTEPRLDLSPEEKLQFALDSYLDYVAQNGKAFITLMRSGIGVDDEVAKVMEKTRRALVQRILTNGLGLKKPPPVVRLALRAWIGFVEAASLEWIERKDVDRVTLRGLLASSLAHSLIATGVIPANG